MQITENEKSADENFRRPKKSADENFGWWKIGGLQLQLMKTQ